MSGKQVKTKIMDHKEVSFCACRNCLLGDMLNVLIILIDVNVMFLGRSDQCRRPMFTNCS